MKRRIISNINKIGTQVNSFGHKVRMKEDRFVKTIREKTVSERKGRSTNTWNTSITNILTEEGVS